MLIEKIMKKNKKFFLINMIFLAYFLAIFYTIIAIGFFNIEFKEKYFIALISIAPIVIIVGWNVYASFEEDVSSPQINLK